MGDGTGSSGETTGALTKHEVLAIMDGAAKPLHDAGIDGSGPTHVELLERAVMEKYNEGVSIGCKNAAALVRRMAAPEPSALVPQVGDRVRATHPNGGETVEFTVSGFSGDGWPCYADGCVSSGRQRLISGAFNPLWWIVEVVSRPTGAEWQARVDDLQARLTAAESRTDAIIADRDAWAEGDTKRLEYARAERDQALASAVEVDEKRVAAQAEVQRLQERLAGIRNAALDEAIAEVHILGYHRAWGMIGKLRALKAADAPAMVTKAECDRRVEEAKQSGRNEVRAAGIEEVAEWAEEQAKGDG